MTLELPAIQARQPFGWLASIGMIRVLSEQWPQLSAEWDLRWQHLVLHDGPANIDAASAAVWQATVGQVPEGGLLPRVAPEAVADRWRSKDGFGVPWGGPDGPLWHHALISGNGLLHPLIRPIGQQTLARALRKILDLLSAGKLSAAITGLGFVDEFRTALHVLQHELSTGAYAASPGRDWLMIMSLPWLPVRELQRVEPAGPALEAGAPGWPTPHTMIWQPWAGRLGTDEIREWVGEDPEYTGSYRATRRSNPLAPKTAAQLIVDRSTRAALKPPDAAPILPGRNDLLERLRLLADYRNQSLPALVTMLLEAGELQLAAAGPDAYLPPGVPRAAFEPDMDDARLRARLTQIGSANADAAEVITEAIRRGPSRFTDAEIATLTGRDRSGIWRLRRTTQT